MENVNPVYNYTIAQDGDYSAITYRKKIVSSVIMFPLALYMLIPAGIVASIIGSGSNSVGLGFFCFLLVIIGVPYLILYLTNSKRTQGEIKIGKNELIANGKHYQLDHISTFIIKERKGADRERFTTTKHSAMQGVSKSLGDALTRQLDAAGFRIAIRYASKEIIIAEHLGEFEAESLFDKITQIAGYTKTK